MSSGVGWITHLPAERFEEVVAADLNSRRDKILNRRIGAAEQRVFAACFEIVIQNMKRAWPIPATQRLGVVSGSVDLVNVRVRDRDLRAVKAHAALHFLRIEAMYPTPTDFNVIRNFGGSLRAGANLNQVVDLCVRGRSDV